MTHDPIGHALQLDQNSLQREQNRLARAQVHELQQIHAHLHLQQHHQQTQATLAEALVQTELRARQVAVVAADDPFAAAVLAHLWQSSVGQIGANQFANADDKRAWLAAWGQLEKTRSFLDHHPTEAATAQRYLNDMAQLPRLGPRPEPAAVQTAEEAMTKARGEAGPVRKIRTGASLTLVALLFVSALIAPPQGQHLSPLVGLAVVVPFYGSIGAIFHARSLSSRKTRAEAAHAVLVAQFERHQAFDRAEGAFLSTLLRQHPWLQRTLPGVEHLPPLSGPGLPATPQVMHSIVQRDVVERQVVVARCKFCQGLTPVDAPNCQHCGAFKFV